MEAGWQVSSMGLERSRSSHSGAATQAQPLRRSHSGAATQAPHGEWTSHSGATWPLSTCYNPLPCFPPTILSPLRRHMATLRLLQPLPYSRPLPYSVQPPSIISPPCAVTAPYHTLVLSLSPCLTYFLFLSLHLSHSLTLCESMIV